MVGPPCRKFECSKLLLWLHHMLEFDDIDTSLVEGGFEVFVVCGGCLGGVWLAIKVVMVIMTSNGFPTCIPHSLSTGEIIFMCIGGVLDLYFHFFVIYNSLRTSRNPKKQCKSDPMLGSRWGIGRLALQICVISAENI